MKAKLKHPLPPNRTYEQVWNHYQVERALADRLKNADRDGRRLIYRRMYDELFAKVPDHPRLTKRSDTAQTKVANLAKFKLVSPFLRKDSVFLEFAPGDCRFAIEVAAHVAHVYAVDISDQSGLDKSHVGNFELILYDGYSLTSVPDSSVDIVFSDQLIEHFHPDETRAHFEIVHRLLKPGGVYVFRTPHPTTGPWDVSRYFCDAPEGFHLKEWTYAELGRLLEEVGFSKRAGCRLMKGRVFIYPYVLLPMAERMLNLLPRALRIRLARYIIPEVSAVATK